MFLFTSSSLSSFRSPSFLRIPPVFPFFPLCFLLCFLLIPSFIIYSFNFFCLFVISFPYFPLPVLPLLFLSYLLLILFSLPAYFLPFLFTCFPFSPFCLFFPYAFFPHHKFIFVVRSNYLSSIFFSLSFISFSHFLSLFSLFVVPHFSLSIHLDCFLSVLFCLSFSFFYSFFLCLLPPSSIFFFYSLCVSFLPFLYIHLPCLSSCSFSLRFLCLFFLPFNSSSLSLFLLLSLFPFFVFPSSLSFFFSLSMEGSWRSFHTK